MPEEEQPSIGLTDDQKLDQSAIRAFRDTADEDYIAARMAFRARLVAPALWSSLHSLEKYLKCILLLERVPCLKISHKLGKALEKLNGSGVEISLTRPTRDFISKLDRSGNNRYFESSYVLSYEQLFFLDRTVWEVRRFCSEEIEPRRLALVKGKVAPKYELPGGLLEQLLRGSPESFARKSLVWNNVYWGTRHRKQVRIHKWLKMANAPLCLHPDIIGDMKKLVRLSKKTFREPLKNSPTEDMRG